MDPTPKCPVIPNISYQINVIEDKCNDVIDTAIDYYVANINYTSNKDDFESGLKERIANDQSDWSKSIQKAYNGLRNATSISEDDFKDAYSNGGFMEPSLSCYNQVISQLRLTEEKTRAKVESTSQLVELFEYYMKKKKAGRKN